MRACWLTVLVLSCAGCLSTTSSGLANQPAEPPPGAQPRTPAFEATEEEWSQFLRGHLILRKHGFESPLDLVDKYSVERRRLPEPSTSPRDRLTEETEYYYFPLTGEGDGGLSYNPELRRMGLKVGRDGNLHRVGPDARDARDPDEGPPVEWEELHRKQFGH